VDCLRLAGGGIGYSIDWGNDRMRFMPGFYQNTACSPRFIGFDNKRGGLLVQCLGGQVIGARYLFTGLFVYAFVYFLNMPAGFVSADTSTHALTYAFIHISTLASAKGISV